MTKVRSQIELHTAELLAGLAPGLNAALPPDVLARVRRNVHRAAWQQTHRRLRGWVACLTAAAAAIVLAVGLDRRSGEAARPQIDPAASLEAWADASAETEVSFTRLAREVWPEDDGDELADDAFESVEQSFDAFTDALGA